VSIECVEAIVAGRVQGVGYREFARRVAERRGLAGFVRNRADGAVEMRLVGAPDAIDAALAELRRGPPHGRVASLAVTARGPAAPESGFAVAPSA
jgi:acylphosphatase